jgi:hypothetical protein
MPSNTCRQNHTKPKKVQLNLEVKPEIRSELEALAVEAKKSKTEVLEEIIDLAYAFKLHLPDWKERVLKEYLESDEAKSERVLNLILEKTAGVKQIEHEFKLSEWMVKQYVLCFEDKEKRKEFIERWLRGEIDLRNMRMVYINGKPEMVMLDKDGYPILADTPKENLVRCEKGWHIKNTMCDKKCKWAECKVRLEERAEYKTKQSLAYEKKRLGWTV